MFIIGQGSRFAELSVEYRERYLYNGCFSATAAAREAAMETARIALAPRRDLVGVPSSEIILWSRPRWSAASKPMTALASSPLALAAALSTPLPRYLVLSPSRSSSASCSPVDAPDGTAPRPNAPPSRRTSASTVGFPRESRTWRAWTRAIFVDMLVVLLRPKPIGDFTEFSRARKAGRGKAPAAYQADSGSSISDSWRTTTTRSEER